jgi:anti-anti-sigma factor
VQREFAPLRNALTELVGFSSRHSRHPLLGSVGAYEVAYWRLHDAVSGLLPVGNMAAPQAQPYEKRIPDLKPPRKTSMCEPRIDITETRQGLIVRIEGEAGYLAADALQGPLTRLLARRPHVVVLDLAGLTFLASLVLGALVSFRRALARHGGRVKLAGLQPAVRETFHTAGLLTLFQVSETVAEALGASTAGTGT